LKPNKEYGHRLVVDLEKPAAVSEPAPRPARTADDEPRDVVVAVDAGHGGEDPGAHGRHGTQEKNVVLAISRRLARLIDREPGMRAVLIRDGDYYLSLRERIKKARAHKADLFVSVHADAFRNPRVKGSSVYVLSAKGASDEAARWLAERENAADLVGGVSLTDKDDVLASVLLDLSLTGTIDASTRAAGKNTIKIGPLASTMMACDEPLMDQESLYLAALESATEYTIEGFALSIAYPGGTLLFYDQDGPRPRR